jgi:hypothetical protein
MLRALHLWWQHLVDRRGASRRHAQHRREQYRRHQPASARLHGTLGKPHFGRFDTLVNARRWLNRALALAFLAALAWIAWESWHGLAIFRD